MQRPRPLPLLASVFVLSSPVFAQIEELVTFGGPGGFTGNHVALDDGVAVMFSNGARLVDPFSGQILHPLVAGGASPEEFVASLAIDGGLVAVGQPTFQSDTDTGAAYIYDVATGQQLHRLLPPGGSIESRFGWSIDLHAGRVLVGAPFEDQAGDNVGAAYLFDAQTGQFLRQFLPPTSAPSQYFGESVALDGDTVLIGATSPTANPVMNGAAYLFSAGTGQLLHQLDPPSTGHDVFGHSAALSSGIAAVGSLLPNRRGQVTTFDVATGAQLRVLTAPVPLAHDRFGQGLDADEGRLIAGATQHTDVGDAYVIDLASGALLQHMIPSNGGLNDWFGAGVAVDGPHALVGSPGHFNGTNEAGSVYLYGIERLGQSVCPQAPNSSGQAGRITATGSTSLAHAVVHLRADELPASQPGVFFVGTNLVQLPLGNGVRCAGGSVVRLSRPTFSSGGVLERRVDFARGGASLLPGTLYFQCWYRDTPGGGAQSHVTDCAAVTFTP